MTGPCSPELPSPGRAPILQADESGILQATERVRVGGLIAFPTETVYGLGADPNNADAIERLFEAKGRDPGKAVLLLIPGLRSLSSLVAHVPPSARVLMDAFWPGPLTLVFRARPGLSPRLLGGGQTLGIRVSNAPVVRELLSHLGGPLTGTSANRSGTPPTLSASEAASQLGGRVDLVLDGGPAPDVQPSTVVDVSSAEVRVRRAGPISASQVWRALGSEPS